MPRLPNPTLSYWPAHKSCPLLDMTAGDCSASGLVGEPDFTLRQ